MSLTALASFRPITGSWPEQGEKQRWLAGMVVVVLRSVTPPVGDLYTQQNHHGRPSRGNRVSGVVREVTALRRASEVLLLSAAPPVGPCRPCAGWQSPRAAGSPLISQRLAWAHALLGGPQLGHDVGRPASTTTRAAGTSRLARAMSASVVGAPQVSRAGVGARRGRGSPAPRPARRRGAVRCRWARRSRPPHGLCRRSKNSAGVLAATAACSTSWRSRRRGDTHPPAPCCAGAFPAMATTWGEAASRDG